MAEGSDRTVIIRANPLSYYIGKAINQDLRSCLFSILKEEFLSRLLTASVFRRPETAGKTCLYTAGKHYRRFILIFLKDMEKFGSQAEVPFLEIFRILRSIYAGKMKDKIRLLTIFFQVFRSGGKVILINLFYLNLRSGFVLIRFNIFQIFYKIPSHKSCSSRNQYIHLSPP